MPFYKLLLSGLFSVALLSGCSLISNEKDIVKMSPLPTVNNQFTPSVVWSISVGNGTGNFYSHLHPAYTGGLVYAADRKGIVKAINVDNGKKIWSVNLAERDGWFSRVPALLSGGLSVSGGHIYIGSEKAQVYALNISDGTIAWKTHAIGEVLSCPVVSNNIVLVHTSNGQLQAFNEADGAVKWTVNLLDMPVFSLRGESAPAVVFGAAIIGSDGGRVSAILMQNGQIIWQRRISQVMGSTEIDRLNDIDSTPMVVDGIVYALAYNSNLTALDLRSGRVIWKRELSSINDFIIDNNRIYLVDQDDQLLALSIKGGKTLWTQNGLSYRLLTAPALYNANLVVGDNEGYIHWIDPESGHFLAQKEVDDSGFLSEPIVADSKLLIQARSGVLYAITR